MPHFTLGIDPAGPILNAGVSVSQGRRAALIEQGLPVPQMRVIRALVDTGASFTSVEPEVLTLLGLTPTGTMDIVTPSTGLEVHTTDTFDVDFLIGPATDDEVPLTIPNLRVGASLLFLRQGIHALIGRDILKRCILIYNGSTNSFCLSF